MNQQRFERARLKVLSNLKKQSGIGTLAEKSVHAVLKAYYEPYEDSCEIRIGSYVADIVGEDGIIEIQTRQFSRLTEKLKEYLPKWIATIDSKTGAVLSRRKSPLHGNLWNLLEELCGIKEFLGNPSLSFRTVLLEAEELRTAGTKRQNLSVTTR